MFTALAAGIAIQCAPLERRIPVERETVEGWVHTSSERETGVSTQSVSYMVNHPSVTDRLELHGSMTATNLSDVNVVLSTYRIEIEGSCLPAGEVSEIGEFCYHPETDRYLLTIESQLLPGQTEIVDFSAFVQTSNPYDLDGNGVVTGEDLGMLLASWGDEGPADFNKDGRVDGADLGRFSLYWLD